MDALRITRQGAVACIPLDPKASDDLLCGAPDYMTFRDMAWAGMHACMLHSVTLRLADSPTGSRLWGRR